jgi:hypothetical protein
MLDRAKAAVSDKNKTAMTPMAQRDMNAPNEVALSKGERKWREKIGRQVSSHGVRTMSTGGYAERGTKNHSPPYDKTTYFR